jgi:hypothetical protein
VKFDTPALKFKQYHFFKLPIAGLLNNIYKKIEEKKKVVDFSLFPIFFYYSTIY